MDKKFNATKCLSKTEAMDLFKNEMDGDDMNETQIKQMVKTCDGVPKLLKLVAGFIYSDEDKMKAFYIVMQDAEKFNGQPFENIDHYVFAFDIFLKDAKIHSLTSVSILMDQKGTYSR